MTRLDLAANYQTLERLRKDGIQAVLWEDVLSSEDLSRLHRKLKAFCNEWFVDRFGVDRSRHEGVSFGLAMKGLLEYDFESWVRVGCFFEIVADLGRDVHFYVPGRTYFPEVVYKYAARVAVERGLEITFVSLDVTDLGIEASARQLMSKARLTGTPSRYQKARSAAIIAHAKRVLRPTRAKDVRCLLIGLRNIEEYLCPILGTGRKASGLTIFLSEYYYCSRRLLFDDRCSNVLRLARQQPNHAQSVADREWAVGLSERAAHRAVEWGFGGEIAGDFLGTYLREHLLQALPAQLTTFRLLARIVSENGINVTVCDGPDAPETVYCGHLMRDRGGLSVFMPHGLIRLDPELDPGRESLADHYFAYSEVRRQALGEYGIPADRIHPIAFLKPPEGELPKMKVGQLPSVMIVLDNHQVSLASRINYFREYRGLVAKLVAEGVTDITVRLNNTFRAYFNHSEAPTEALKRYFGPAKVQWISEIPLRESIQKVQLVIGPLSTCVLEAAWSGVFYLPYIPTYRPRESKEEIAQVLWLAGLHPSIAETEEELGWTLKAFMYDPVGETSRFRQSVRRVNLFSQPGDRLFARIALLAREHSREQSSVR